VPEPDVKDAIKAVTDPANLSSFGDSRRAVRHVDERKAVAALREVGLGRAEAARRCPRLGQGPRSSGDRRQHGSQPQAGRGNSSRRGASWRVTGRTEVPFEDPICT
jgi:hypothetical protein